MNVGFYSDRGQLLDESRISCSRAEYHLEDLAREAQDLANECGCSVVAFIRNEHGEPTNRLGIEANPQPGQ
ncbi:hypothetical protein VNPA120661_67850 [Pseudomonas aeruginosa]|uniref:hypothetical protein n=1 Tax=Pseudomonas aeruginosa TaxID=287 RepID=UPI00035D0352|nr:hypothetical protein [Pseudomonas aeruginosa]EVT82491.1 hypothetical protein Z046_32530 [Pseudomonas aeruginosa VRFPA09]APB61006.1 hypothetical protein PA7790_06466 [Pseudomonas aeruginosa]EKO9559283.1 hypothetical protein [Pseudomonas aeruginosa]KSG44284.1 hypothetical protein AO955_25520 [Pseudomonas aeruginosa]KSP76097.1 hypothetical protein APB20_29260 [Pseudomonas aeruginosa]